MFNSIDKEDIIFSIRDGLYLPFMYKGRQIVVHNASWSFREKIWVDDDLVVNRLGVSMTSTHVLDVEGDALEVTFGYRNGMKEIFLEARADGTLVHEVRHETGWEVKPATLALSMILGGAAGLALGYLVGSLLGSG